VTVAIALHRVAKLRHTAPSGTLISDSVSLQSLLREAHAMIEEMEPRNLAGMAWAFAVLRDVD
jgi:hypothetical protein